MLIINQDKCSGCGVCEMTFPEYFLLEGGVSTVVQQPDPAIRVTDCCPNSAIEDTCAGCTCVDETAGWYCKCGACD